MAEPTKAIDHQANESLAQSLARRQLTQAANAMERREDLSATELLAWAAEARKAGLLDKPLIGSDTALTLACLRCDPDLASELLALGADPNAPTRHGQSPMMQSLASMGEPFGSHPWPQVKPCMEMLLAAGADIHRKNQIGQQPILWAAWESDLEPARWLLAHGADPSAADGEGNAPLHHAAKAGRLDAARLFVEAGADLEATCENPEARLKSSGKKKMITPLEVAIQWSRFHGSAEVVGYLAQAQLAAVESKQLAKGVKAIRSPKKAVGRI